MQDKIGNSSYDNVEYGVERTTQTPIQIDPYAEDMYEEATSENIEEIYVKRKMMDVMNEIYEQSEYFSKYGGVKPKKVERSDLFGIYYYFKDELRKRSEYTIVQIFITIAEFFDLNYRTLYNDILTLEDKVEILDHLSDEYGLERQFAKSNPLF
jgi:hypothetical protein